MMTKDFVKVDKWGECLWGIDENGTLFINEGEAADLAGENAPWYDDRESITEVSTIGNISFPEAASLAGLFRGCRNLEKADLSGFNTSNVKDMSYMFEACINLEELDLSSFNTLSCSNMKGMFGNCIDLKNILLGEAFSTSGDGTTDAGKLAIKEENKYRRARVISVDGFKVRYHDENGDVIEKKSVPNFRYVVENDLFKSEDENTKFLGWSTEPNAGGSFIRSGQELRSVSGDIDFYCVRAHAPKLGPVESVRPFSFGEQIPFALPEIESKNAPEVTGFLEISPDGSEGSWIAIERDTILPVSCDGYYLRLHASNVVGAAVSEPVKLHIRKANVNMSSVRWTEQDDMVYNGEPKKVWVEGLPEGVEATYSGNVATEAGTYKATFNLEIDKNNFNVPPVVKDHEWTIKKAVYDMSNVRWNYEGAFGYTGEEYKVELKGLPEGVSATYENNTAINAGVYTAVAILSYDEVNYERPAEINPCTWEIRKVAIDPAKLQWTVCDDFIYDGNSKSVRITNLPEGIEVEYSGDRASSAGKYLARANMLGNYCTSGPAEYEWEIKKAKYDMSKAMWSVQSSYTYDGNKHVMELSGVPEELEVRYSGNEGLTSGEYKARASFINPDTHNFETPEDMEESWEIIKRFVDMSEVKWNYEGPFDYDGLGKRIELVGLPEGIGVEYKDNSSSDAGIYNAQAHLVYDEDNFVAEDPMDCRWMINKKRVDVSGVKWAYDEAFTYDGTEHRIELENIPDGLIAEYADNAKVNAGKYVASATLIANDDRNYEVPKISGCTWSINKAEIPMPEMEWTDSSEFIYDGTEKKVQILSDPGDAVTVDYRNNSAVNAGRYYAKAVFSAVDDSNYNAPKELGYSWEIAKADYDMSGVHWDYEAPFTYDGDMKSVRVAGVPKGVKVSYRNAEAKDAGAYNAVAEFEVLDKVNYYDNIPDMLLDWSIQKARYDMASVHWQEDREFSYDGSAKSIRLSGLPDGLEPVYEGNTASVAGQYTAKASFKYDEKNYEEPELASCHWVVDKTALDISAVRWNYESPYKYDGTEKKVELVGVPEGAVVNYSNETATTAGSYIAAAEIIPEDTDNLTKSKVENLNWRIEKGDYDMSHVHWDYEKAFTYDGQEHKVVVKGYPEGVTPIYRGNSAKAAGKYEASVTFKVADKKNFNIPVFENLTWEIAKADYDMSNAKWDYEGTITYDGRMHEVLLRGLPEGVKAVYSGNAAAETGSYEATAELVPYDKANYNIPTADKCSWQIAKADYDMSKVRWDYKDAKVYNGRGQGVMLDQLPNGVLATYSGNEGVKVGKYTAKAVLTVSDSANYNTPAVADCDWEIVPADYDISSVSWDYEADKYVYDGERKTVELKGLPKSIEADYKGNSATHAGDYVATANFVSNDANFKAPDPISMNWSIAKANHNMREVYWDYSENLSYDGTPKRIELKGVPKGIKVNYVDNEKTDAGTYTAVAHFEAETEDFNAPEDMSCVWTIDKGEVDIRKLSWDYSQPFKYNGENRSVKLKGLSNLLEAKYSGNEAVDSGSYMAEAELVPLDPANYNTPAIGGCKWEIIKADYDMTNARWEGDFDSEYDGRQHGVYIEGLPEGLKAVYSGNEATSVGDYVASAELAGDYDNYNPVEIDDCSWKIRKASFDMTHVAWQEQNDFVYDGSSKHVELVGLPEGIKPVYSDNTATEVGDYEAAVSFEYDEHNYEAPEFGNFKWNIAKADIPVNIGEVHWNYSGPFVYDGTEKSVALAQAEEKPGFFERLRGKGSEIKLEGVPEGFDVVYEGNTATDAGVYYASAKLVSKDGSNYTETELPRCKWEIAKAPIDMIGVHWNYETPFSYDGEEKSVELVGLPENVKVSYSDNTAKNAGTYEAMAVIEAADPANFEEPNPVAGCWWQIDKAVYDMSEARWVFDEDLIYNGKEHKVRVIGLPDGVRVASYEGNKEVNAGSYLAEANLRYRDKSNYEEPILPECRWRIEKKTVDVSEVRWDYDESSLMVYDGKPKTVKLIGVPKEVEVIYIDNSKINAGTYTARAKLSYDSNNFEVAEIPDIKWTIEKASYNTDKVHWTYDKPFEYDGKNKTISLVGLPSSIDVKYRDNKASKIGTYTAKAYLTYDSENYKEPEVDATIDWSIVRKQED